MAVVGDTGQGATLSFSTTTITFVIKKLTLPEWMKERVEALHLGLTDFTNYIPGDLADPGELQAEVVFETGDDAPAIGVVETGTVTFPLRAGEGTAANLAGTGFIRGFSLPGLETNTLQLATLTFAFNGDTGPAFTKSVAA